MSNPFKSPDKIPSNRSNIILKVIKLLTSRIQKLTGIKNPKNCLLSAYLSNNLKIERYYNECAKFKNEACRTFRLKANFDLVIKGLGFIKTTNDTEIKIYLLDKVKIDIRESLI